MATMDGISRKSVYIFVTVAATLLSFLHGSAAADDAAVMAKLAKSISPTPASWSGSNFCKWSGISCDSSGRVTSINLASKSLSGTLPSEISQLDQLRSLNLQNNDFSGSLPQLSGLTFLKAALLVNNKFSSVPPNFLSGLTNLQNISIDQNKNLSPWTIPVSLVNSTSLVSLQASACGFVGNIPDIFGSFPNLIEVRLSYNNLTGSLPPSFAKSAIQRLWINNQEQGLSGRLDVIGSMTSLTEAWLHVNHFTGPIPDLSGCTSLSDIQLRDNDLTGVIPPSLTSLPKLVNVSLQNNKFQGPVPSFPKNVQVTLGNTNNFCTNSPAPCDSQVTALLAIAGAMGYPQTLANSWKGNDPCQNWQGVNCDPSGIVTTINLKGQGWPGKISPAYANLTGLKTLLLSDNSLTGTIPASLTSLQHLQTLDVSNNNLSGKVPDFPHSVVVNTSGNQFIGQDMSSGGGSATGSSESSSKKKDMAKWVIVVVVVISSMILVTVLSLVICKLHVTKRDGKYAWVKGGKKRRKASFNAAPGRSPSQSGENSDFSAYEGGNNAIPIEILREVTNDFSEDNIIGKGGFGIVYRGQLPDGTQIAVKRMQSSVSNTKAMNEFQAEIEVLTKVRHRHLVALHGFCVNGIERLLVYEYMSQGTLGQHLYGDEMGFCPLNWNQRLIIALDVARAIEYLHGLAQQSFIHRDLKPSNILLGEDLRAKVSDFGLVKSAPIGKYSVETRLAGTFGYLAPEYAATGRVTTKVDVFAFGVVLMEMITGRKALDESFPEDSSHLAPWFRKFLGSRDGIKEIIDLQLDPNHETFESIWKVSELAGHCTAREPQQRPDMSHVVSILSPLVEQWKPSGPEEEDDGYGINFNMSLSQALQRWQALDNSSISTLHNDIFGSHIQGQTSTATTSTGVKLSDFSSSSNTEHANDKDQKEAGFSDEWLPEHR